jgi:hypothetical protein
VLSTRLDVEYHRPSGRGLSRSDPIFSGPTPFSLIIFGCCLPATTMKNAVHSHNAGNLLLAGLFTKMPGSKIPAVKARRSSPERSRWPRAAIPMAFGGLLSSDACYQATSRLSLALLSIR